jgi:hypothetical protein
MARPRNSRARFVGVAESRILSGECLLRYVSPPQPFRRVVAVDMSPGLLEMLHVGVSRPPASPLDVPSRKMPAQNSNEGARSGNRDALDHSNSSAGSHGGCDHESDG